MAQVGINNTFIKDHAASGRMVVEYSRNPKDFRLPNYIQVKPVTKQEGYYLAIDVLQAGRLVGGTVDDFVWTDGMDRPQTNAHGQEFNWKAFKTIRRNISDRLGDLARQQADWSIEDTQEGSQAQQAMTLRTKLVHTALATSANWDASHFLNVTSIAGVGGAWNASLSTNQYIRKSINYAVKTILLDTLSKVRKEDLILVLNPTAALAISETQELIDVIKQSADAYDQVRGAGKWAAWGIPDRLYGLEVVVEDTAIVTSPKGAATPTKSFVMADATAMVLSRPGGLVAKNGPSFSTVTLFAKEEMTVERTQDAYNRVLKIDVVDDVGVGITAPATGVVLNAILA